MHDIVRYGDLPFEKTMSFLSVVDVVTLVDPAIDPCKNSLTMHHVVLPLTRIGSAVSPYILAEPTHFISIEVTVVGTSIGPLKLAFTLLLAKNIPPSELRAIVPVLSTHTMMLIVQPLSLVR